MDLILMSAVALVVLTVVFIWVGLVFQRRIASSEQFLAAGRTVPLWLMVAAIIGGGIGGAISTGWTGLGYISGLNNFWLGLFALAAIVVFIFLLAKRINYFGRTTGTMTMADFACARYGERMRLPMSILTFLRPGFITGMQYLALGVVLQVAFGWPLPLGIVVSAVLMLFYTAMGGQYSMLVTSWLQTIFQSISLIVIFIAAFSLLGSDIGSATAVLYKTVPTSFVDVFAFDPSVISVWFLTFFAFYLVDPWLYMWAFIAKDPKTSSNAQLISQASSYYSFLPVMTGMAIYAAVKTGVLTIPSNVTPDGLYSWFAINKLAAFWGAVLIVGLAMTILSCASSFILNGAQILTRDIYVRVMNPNASDATVLVASRWSVVAVTIFGIACALWLPTLVPLWVLAQALAVSGLLAPMLSAWFWKRATSSAAFWSSVLGGLTALGWAMMAWQRTGSPGGLIRGLHAGHVGLAVSIPVMIVVSLLTKPEYDKAKVTDWVEMGKALKASDPASKETGIFGWLGAMGTTQKVLWGVLFVFFALHYIVPPLAKDPAGGIALVWLAVGAAITLLLLMTVLGLLDILKIWRVPAAQPKKPEDLKMA